MITLDLSILNQKGTPMFFSDLTANRPAAGIVGRIFIATDSPYGIFRDTGSAWVQIAGSGGGGGNTIYTANDTLTSNRTVSSGGFTLTFAPQTTFLSSLTAATNASRYSALGQNTLSYAAGFSSSNLGLTYGAIGGINLQTFAGSATFAQSNLAAANISVNSIDFSSAGSTITMTQATGLRVMAGHQSQFQYQGTNSGTITHAAISQNLGFYRPPAATGILTITNAYGHLINDLNDYGSGFTFTNRWGIYQAGANDTNYFAGSILSGTTINAGFKLDIAGSGRFNTSTSGTSSFTLSVIDSNSLIGANILVKFPGLNGTVFNQRGSGMRISTENGSADFFGLKTTGSVIVGGNENTPTITKFSVFVSSSSLANDGITIIDNTTSATTQSTFGFYSRFGNKYLARIGCVGGSGFSQTALTFNIDNGSGTLNELMRMVYTGNMLIGSTIDNGQKFQLTGSIRVDGQISATAGGSSGQHLIINCDGVSYKIALLNPL